MSSTILVEERKNIANQIKKLLLLFLYLQHKVGQSWKKTRMRKTTKMKMTKGWWVGIKLCIWHLMNCRNNLLVKLSHFQFLIKFLDYRINMTFGSVLTTRKTRRLQIQKSRDQDPQLSMDPELGLVHVHILVQRAIEKILHDQDLALDLRLSQVLERVTDGTQGMSLTRTKDVMIPVNTIGKIKKVSKNNINLFFFSKITNFWHLSNYYEFV